MTAQALNTIGLIANMLGVFLAFFFGFPQPDHKEGGALALMPATTRVDDKRIRSRRNLYKCVSTLALILMFVGFGVQVAALWLGR
ncbi:hypothetical protein A8H39_20630 [Paraburkholderia fungorum]|uniref:hypothetical protein n=1 Tax=Paraburkholderia fungorum TaxID=134537 RepID=UPI0004845F8B|nr:hypothetical protein [Paraburkholderia fungorum]MBB5546352.1 fatty acid desaturase [Paraburkholderia fungorum]PNE58007.1 hypothetical protein A8H39_20630 [Paraburkholderia fungorum]